MLRSSDQCHEISIAQIPVRLNNSSSNVNEHQKSGFLQIKFRPLPINNLLVKVNHHCCSIFQHPASSQNQKPRCSSSTYPKPSFWLWQMKWSVAQNRVCMAKFEKRCWLTSYGLGTTMTSSWFAAKQTKRKPRQTLKSLGATFVCILKCTPFISPMCEGSGIRTPQVYLHPLCLTSAQEWQHRYHLSRSLGYIVYGQIIASALLLFRNVNSLQLLQTSLKVRDPFVCNGPGF